MTKKEQQAHFGYIIDQMRKTLFSKGDDYANEDRLSNFKLAGAITGGDASTNCLNLIATKVARLGVLINSCLLYTSPSPRDRTRSRMPSSA